MKYWEIRKTREGRPPKHFGVWQGLSTDDALERFLHVKGVGAEVCNGKLFYRDPQNFRVWGERSVWEVEPWHSAKYETPSARKERSIIAVRGKIEDYL